MLALTYRLPAFDTKALSKLILSVLALVFVLCVFSFMSVILAVVVPLLVTFFSNALLALPFIGLFVITSKR